MRNCMKRLVTVRRNRGCFLPGGAIIWSYGAGQLEYINGKTYGYVRRVRDILTATLNNRISSLYGSFGPIYTAAQVKSYLIIYHN